MSFSCQTFKGRALSAPAPFLLNPALSGELEAVFRESRLSPTVKARAAPMAYKRLGARNSRQREGIKLSQ